MRFNNIQIARLALAVATVSVHLSTYAQFEFGITGGVLPLLRLPGLAAVIAPTFFAISGFVLTHVLQGSPPGRFLVHRAVRLYPGYWLAMGAVTGACAAGLWPGPYLVFTEPRPTLETLLLTPPTGYRLGQYPLVVEWTLIYEVALWIGLIGLRLAVGVRGVPYAAAAWLAVLAVKSLLWPGLGSLAIPTWKTVWVSVYVAPFLMGILAYTLADRGRAWRWPVLAAVVALNLVAAVWVPFDDIDPHQWLRGVAAGLTVWFLVQIPDAGAKNRLVVAGGYSYGLYLLHIPLLLLSMRVLERAGWPLGQAAGLTLAGVVAVTAGLTFGRVEVAMHAKLKRAADSTLAAAAKVRRPRPRVWASGFASRVSR